MIPSLVVDEVRQSLAEYLASTFGLADDEVRKAPSEFLQDQADGVFRGPYLRVRTPFASVDQYWRSPLDWLPGNFQPHAHQATSFDRLGSRVSAPQCGCLIGQRRTRRISRLKPTTTPTRTWTTSTTASRRPGLDVTPQRDNHRVRSLLQRWLGIATPAPEAPARWLGAEQPVLDLRDEPVPFVLLDDTHAWRERLVEDLLIQDGDHIEVTSSYQLRLQPDLLQRIGVEVATGDKVRLILPLTTRPKDLLLGVDLAGPEGPCALLLKSQIALLQLRYLEWNSERPIGPDVANLLYGMFTFNRGIWDHCRLELVPKSRCAALARYLSDGVDLEISTAEVDKMHRALSRSRKLLQHALGEPVDPDSLLTTLVLALPFVELPPKSVAEVHHWIDQLDRFLNTAPQQVREIIAEYCVRWEVMIDVVIPVGEPCKVKLATRRPWGSKDPRRTTQRLAIGDAATAHIDLRVADHSVYIASKPGLRNLQGATVGIPVVDDLRFADDVASIYVSNNESRPYFVDMTVELSLRRSTVWMMRMLWLLVAVAFAVTLVLPEDGDLADGLALLVFPLTLAGTLVLTRATTGVAQRLHERNRMWLTAAIGLMWIVALGRLLAADVDLGWLIDTARDLRHTVGSW